MPGHKLTFRLKQKTNLVDPARPEAPPPSTPQSENDIFGYETEVFLDDQRLQMIQKLAISIDAETMIPVVFLAFIPTALNIEVDAPAEVYKALAEVKTGFMHDLFGKRYVAGLPPLELPKESSLSAQESEKLIEEWKKMYSVPEGPAYHGDRGAEAPTGQAALDALVHGPGPGVPVAVCHKLRTDEVSPISPEQYAEKLKPLDSIAKEKS
jgi:hypothetical protein